MSYSLRFRLATLMTVSFLGGGIFLQIAFAADSKFLGTYDSYKEQIENACYADALPWNQKIGGQEVPRLTSLSRFVYPDVFDSKAQEKYASGLKSFKWSDPSALAEYEAQLTANSDSLPLGTSLERASIVYKERMNTVYACAVLSTKLRIHNRLLKSFKPDSSNAVESITEASRKISTRITEMGCTSIADSWEKGSELSLKRSLIRDSVLEYCNYRHYLGYVDYSVGNRIWELVQAEFKARGTGSWELKASDLLPATENIAQALSDFASRSSQEIARTQWVFPEAFEAYREFDRNYASHVLMVLIEDKYLRVREYLRDTMNPIGQVIYQASNATSPGK